VTSDSLQSGLALLFDMDGVIIDSNPVHKEAWARFNLRYGLATTAAMTERMYGKRNDEIVRDFFGEDLSREEVAARGPGGRDAGTGSAGIPGAAFWRGSDGGGQ